MPRRLVCLLVLLLAAAPALRAQQPDTAAMVERRPVQATDLLQIRQLGDVVLSPDRRSVVYTVRRIVEQPDEEGRYDYRTQLFLVPASGRGAPEQLTFAPEGAEQPAWRPDGEALAFVRPVDGTPQVFVLPLFGGEAFQVTDAEHGADRPRWSPEGDRLLFASLLPERALADTFGFAGLPSERPGRRPDDATAESDADGTLAEVRAWLADNAREGAPRVFDRLDFQDELDLEPEPRYRHWFVTPARPGAEARAVTRGYAFFEDAAWLPDGQTLVLSGTPEIGRHVDRVRDRDLFVAHLDRDTLEPLLDLDGYALSDPTVTPSGDHVAFHARALDDPGYAQTELGVVALDRPAEARLLTLGFDRSVGATRWAADGWHLYFTAPSQGAFPLFRVAAFAKRPAEAAPRADSLARVLGLAAQGVDPDSLDADRLLGPDTLAAALDTAAAATDDTLAVAAGDTAWTPVVERLTGLQTGVRSFDVSDATAYLVLTRPENPYELYARPLAGDRPARRLTAHNAEWLEQRLLSRPEPDTLRRPDGTVVPYWTMRPVPFEEGRRYPLLLQIHGGPMAMWGPGEATMWHEFQYFAGRGYGIVFSNPRGSGGYGDAFQRANYQDWGAGPAGDVLAAAAEAARLPWIDPERQVVTGGSYAGYLTAWIVAHDHRFRAAVAQRGVYDLVTFLGEGNAWRLVPSHFGGYPWETIAPAPADTATAPAASADTARAPTLAFAEALARAVGDSLRAAGIDAPPADTTAADTAAADTATAEGARLAAADTARIPVAVRDILLRESPLTYVDQIRTPLLILHSDQDLRTGVIQSEMLYKALKILERPVEYVRYPNSGHDLSRTGDPRLRLDRLLRIYEFFERFVDSEAPPVAEEVASEVTAPTEQ